MVYWNLESKTTDKGDYCAIIIILPLFYFVFSRGRETSTCMSVIGNKEIIFQFLTGFSTIINDVIINTGAKTVSSVS